MVLGGTCYGQESVPSDRETIQKLMQEVKEVKQLQQRVQSLEDARGPAIPSGPAQAAKPQDQDSEPALSTPAQFTEARGIQWKGFGELDYKALDQKIPELEAYGFVPGSAANFYTGQFDLLVTSRINDKTSVLSELVFEERDAQTYDVNLERLLLKYDFNDHLRMSFGRYHTGIGYYNTAFHSGSWLQTTADRPLIMEFAEDGGILPTQAVGFFVTGEIPSGRLGLNYTAEYGSSDTIRPQITDSGDNVDENNGNHVNFGLFSRPRTIAGLEIGGSFYHDQVSDFSKGPSVRMGQTIINFHAIYAARGVEMLNEGFPIRHVYETGNLVFNMPAFYTQFSKQIGRYRPFVRYQYINANPNSIFNDVLLRRGPSFGLRYDFNDYVALKAQLDHTLRKDQPDLNGIHTQLAFTF
jgi:hypothetical protein